MLSPEVWNFKAPDSSFISQTTTNKDGICLKKINSLKYSHLVSAILPDVSRVPEEFTNTLITDCDYYKISDLNLSELVDKDFIANFVKIGNLSGLSINTRIDCDNCVAVTPEGQIILSLTKSTYQTVGLEGKLSHFNTKTKERYNVTVDLISDHFKPGKPNFERAKVCLKNLQTFTVILCWEPPNERVCPSSIAKYFHELGYQVKLCKPKHDVHTSYSLKVPINFDEPSNFVEWLGMMAIDTEMEHDDEYVSTYQTPEPNIQLGQVKCFQWRGFFTPSQITRFYKAFKAFKQSCSNPWIAMYVQGFSDSPISWNLEEHHFYTNGDIGYIFALDDEKCLICSQQCSRKRYKMKNK